MSSFIKVMDQGVTAAIFAKFGPYLGLSDQNADCVFFPKSIAQRQIAEKRGVANVEFINVWRNRISFDWTKQQSVIGRNGIMMQFNDGTKTEIVTVKANPLKMEYDFWIWSRDLDKLMEATEAYMNWIHSNPSIHFMYNDTYPMDMYIKTGDAVDEGTIDTMFDDGLYYVYHYTLTMEGWALVLSSVKTILTIYLDLFLREGNPPDYVDTLLAEYVITEAGTTAIIHQ